MPNITAALNDHIRRLSRREISGSTKVVKRATAHFRRDIAALKRQIVQLTKVIGVIQKQIPNQTPTPPAEMIKKARLRIDGLKGHRTRLGLSAKDYGKLLGVSGLTVYNWEAGKSKPRRSQLPRLVAVRGIGKREAMQRLGMGAERNGETAVATKAPKPKQRGTFSQTAEEMILSLLKGRKAMTSAGLNAAWKKSGRLGNADNTLSVMTKAGKLKRTKVEGQRGSEYRVAIN